MAKTKAKQDRTQVVLLVTEAVTPIVHSHSATLWDVDFRREGGNSFLSIEIDKEGGVSIELCEAISREIEAFLDKTDPITEAYFLEVGSAGLERTLKKPEHFQAMQGRNVLVKFFVKDKSNSKELKATLIALDGDQLKLESDGQQLVFEMKDLACVKLAYEAI